MIPTLVYTISLVTSLICALLLARSYWHSGTRLLLWTSACFFLLAFNNLMVVVDLIILPETSLLPLRHLASLAAVSVLLVGFIWEAD